MFVHNLKYTIKTLFRNKILIFWTFAFPIILGIFFNMAFSNIEKDEVLKVFDIAVVNNEQFKHQSIYKEAIDGLSKGNDKLFNVQYVTKEKADLLLDDSDVEGYIVFENYKPQVVVKENGTYQTMLKFVVNEITQNKIMVTDLSEQAIRKQMEKGNINVDTAKIVSDILNKMQGNHPNLNKIKTSCSIDLYDTVCLLCHIQGIYPFSLHNITGRLISGAGR